LGAGGPVEPVTGDVEEPDHAGDGVDDQPTGVDARAAKLRLREAVQDVTRPLEVAHEGDDATLSPLRHDEVVGARRGLEHVLQEPAIEAQVEPVEAFGLRRRGRGDGQAEDPRGEPRGTPHRASWIIGRGTRGLEPSAAPRTAFSTTPRTRARKVRRRPKAAATAAPFVSPARTTRRPAPASASARFDATHVFPSRSRALVTSRRCGGPAALPWKSAARSLATASAPGDPGASAATSSGATRILLPFVRRSRKSGSTASTSNPTEPSMSSTV